MADFMGRLCCTSRHFVAKPWSDSCEPRKGMARTPDRPSTRGEILIGRSLAACVHPVAAWGSGSKSARAQFFLGYFVAGYVLVFLALLFLMPSLTSGQIHH